MHIASDRTYRFGLDREEVWAAIADVDGFRTMWPWLRRFDAGALAPDALWTCTVQPPLPYSLTFTLTLDRVIEHQRVRASVAGDITGEAEVMLTSVDGGCEVRLVSRLAPRSRFLRGVALVAWPVAKLGHDWVLDTGARQFRQQLASR